MKMLSLVLRKVKSMLISVALLIVMLLPVNACGKIQENKTVSRCSGDIISEDDPWFESDINEYAYFPIEECVCEFNELNLAGASCGKYILISEGQFACPGTHPVQYSEKDLIIVDSSNLKEIQRFDLYEYFDEISGISYLSVENDSVVIQGATKEDPDSFTELFVDLSDCTCKDRVIEADDLLCTLPAGNSKTDHVYQPGELRIDTVFNYEGKNSFYVLNIYGTDHMPQSTVEVRVSGEDVFDIPMITSIDESKLLIRASCTDGEHYFVLDIDTSKLEERTSKYKWLDRYDDTSFINVKNGECYVTDGSGIYIVDPAAKSEELIFSYDWCCSGEYDLKDLDVIDCSGSTVEFLGITRNVRSWYQDEVLVSAKLKRVEKNPNAGKSILELYSNSDTLSPDIAYAIRRFNSEEHSCYLVRSTRYPHTLLTDTNEASGSYEKTDWNICREQNDISAELSIDLINGTGPDILMDTVSLSLSDSSGLLLNMKDVVDTLGDDCYENIISAAETKNGLYQMPLAFDIFGIQASEEYVGVSGRGFTYDEYAEFVKKSCNGLDPLFLGQTQNLIILYECNRCRMNESLDSDGFRDLALFCKENMPYNGMSYMDYTDALVQHENVPCIVQLYGFGDYILNAGAGMNICGLPSADGNLGAVADITHSVSVASQTAYPEECKEFVKILMSFEAQEFYASSGCNVINRNACAEAIKESKDNLALMDYVVPDNAVESYVSVIEGITDVYVDDPSVSLILSEEMPAYFLDQKELDDVLVIAEDKRQLIIDERYSH